MTKKTTQNVYLGKGVKITTLENNIRIGQCADSNIKKILTRMEDKTKMCVRVIRRQVKNIWIKMKSNKKKILLVKRYK